MSPVNVTPETFNLVLFEAAAIKAIAERLVVDIGLPADLVVNIEVDETTPLGHVKVADLDPVVVKAESGAFEDPKRPRQLSDTGTAEVLGRLLFRVRDRRDPAFGDPPPDDELSLAQGAAWDAYSVGRLVRLGYRHYNNRQRRLYHFRNRHGFTDAADDAFARLWEGSGLTWADIANLSEAASAASAGREPAAVTGG